MPSSSPPVESRILRQESRGVLATINAFSLDAVAVGIAWQSWVAVEFGGSCVSVHESLVLGMTIWLIYTLDRLLDVRTLAVDRPHTRRHAFHREHRQELLILWLVVLAINSIMIATVLSPDALRLAILGSAGVFAYLAAVHLSAKPNSPGKAIARTPDATTNGVTKPRSLNPLTPESRRAKIERLLCKESAIGPLFSFGVFIPVLEHNASLAAWWGTALLAGLFTANCLIVSAQDRDLDLKQGMRSAWKHAAPTDHWLAIPTIVYASFVVLSMATEILPPTFGLTLLISAFALTVVSRQVPNNTHARSNAWFDLAISVAPIVAIALSTFSWPTVVSLTDTWLVGR